MSLPELLDSVVVEFEHAWRQETPPDVFSILASYRDNPHDTAGRERIVTELIAIDLEHRWRRSDRGEAIGQSRSQREGRSVERRMLDDYVAGCDQFATLADVPSELVGEEYRVRRLWGDRPSHEEYRRRFADRGVSLIAILRGIDWELELEESEECVRRAVSSTKAHPPANVEVVPDSAAPLSYGDFVLQKHLGAGSVGKVYRALQKSINKPVAVKYLKKAFLNQPDVVAQFIREARTVAKLRHPGLVGVHGLGRTPLGGYFIVMDLVEGPNLSTLIRNRQLEIDECVRWIAQAAETLGFVHRQGVVHCDLKPGNLLLEPCGRVRITDFGLAKTADTIDDTLTRIAGTAPYMAPEQVAAHRGSIDARTDVYGLGAVLYELLTGRPPHIGRRIADVLAQLVANAPIGAVSSHRPGIPDSLDAICQRCLSQRPQDRYQSADELAAALRTPL